MGRGDLYPKMKEEDVESGMERLRGGDTLMKQAHDSRNRLIIGIVANVMATVAIVYVNKSIFADPSFKHCPSSFASFHFALLSAVLYLTSRPSVALFVPADISTMSAFPLTIIMGANVVLVNLSLAYSSVVLYQIVRVLLTPLTALINLWFYGSRIHFQAYLALIPACVGVGVVSYYDSLSTSVNSTSRDTSLTGLLFAFAGLLSSAVYTVWISQYHKKLKLSSMQLLFNQVPLGSLLLALVGIFTDEFPIWSQVTQRQWMMLAASGLCASVVVFSSFFIINHAGPVSSTVVGHLKTCFIVGLGWIVSSKDVRRESIYGIFLALLGIVLYSIATQRGPTKASM